MHSNEDRGRLAHATAGSAEVFTCKIVLGTRNAKPTASTVGFDLSGMGTLRASVLHRRLAVPANRARTRACTPRNPSAPHAAPRVQPLVRSRSPDHDPSCQSMCNEPSVSLPQVAQRNNMILSLPVFSLCNLQPAPSRSRRTNTVMGLSRDSWETLRSWRTNSRRR